MVIREMVYVTTERALRITIRFKDPTGKRFSDFFKKKLSSSDPSIGSAQRFVHDAVVIQLTGHTVISNVTAHNNPHS